MPTLRPYQLEGVSRLIEFTERYRAAILADEPGCGKTAQVAEFINRTHPAVVMIVCPASLRLNWRRELEKWLTWSPFQTHVLSYEQVVSGLPDTPPVDLAVFDEAHYLKNPAAKRTKACLSIEAQTRLFLTGTPVVNRPMDIYPILKAMGIRLSRVEFGKRFCAGHLICIRHRPAKKYAWDFSGASNTAELNKALRGYCMVRRTKAEVLADLPQKIRQVIELDIPSGESPALRDAVSRMFEGMETAAENIAELKRIAFTELAAARLEIAMHKLPCVCSMIEDLLEEEEKIVVFAHHRTVIDAICQATRRNGFTSIKLYGGMSDKEKDTAVRDFQSGSARVFVGQITAAGTGLTLTAAKTVLFAELDWVPGNVTQAEDRCHRLGQTDPVRIIHLVAKDSVDARMVHALVDKQSTIERIVK